MIWLYHYSEDPTIARFVPHVPATNPDVGAHVWAIDAEHAPLYWFPRDCPRVTTWSTTEREQGRLRRQHATEARRVHWIERAWVERIDAATVYEYRFDPTPFRVATLPTGEPMAPGYHVADHEVTPIDVRPIGSCRDRQAAAGVDLRTVDDLWPIIDAVVESGLPFSIVRKHNARPRLSPE